MGEKGGLGGEMQGWLSERLGGRQVGCVRNEGNPGDSGKWCLAVFGKLSGMCTSWIPLEGITPNLSSGLQRLCKLQAWTVTCGLAVSVAR